MIIVGELINASRKAVAAAIEAQDAETIKKLAKDQHEAGADYIDVNAGVFVGKEGDYLEWLVKNVQEVVDGPCCLDSPDPKVIERGLAVHKGTAMINSISSPSFISIKFCYCLYYKPDFFPLSTQGHRKRQHTLCYPFSMGKLP
jgi:cobalamin-dependent methionine synthase I